MAVKTNSVKTVRRKKISNNTGNPRYSLTAEEKLLTIRMGVVSVIKGYNIGRTILGSTGVGKSYAVKDELNEREAKWIEVTGSIQNHIALYEFLYKNNEPNTIIVFDDCNDIIRNKKCVEILRKAVDISDKRVITFLHANKKFDSLGIPKQFDFVARVIIVSNLSKNKIDDAIVSRTSPVEAFLTPAEMFKVIASDVKNAPPQVPIHFKKEVLHFIEKDIKPENLKRFCFRTFRDCVIWRAASENYDDKELYKKQIYNALCG